MTDDNAHFIPDEGHVVYTDFDPSAGHEQQGKRPAVVLSKQAFNKSGMMICVPMTTKIRNMGWEVPITSLKDDRPSVALANQVQTMDLNARGAELVGRITLDELYRIRYIARTFCGFVPAGYQLPKRG
ncbi:type II toxin-antitoxin system PemK/MazF family toxin [Asticcacaulis excentricus]|uniref:Transcriptional modulator of MazE/toxin, MazF n=1 Tax=Asticcacaulis excentricus (strain ATCC 15261 / DSM 4724 / KCTC 12464 / NCIMB 9791 / VKM B-1370 / CB 48) TaxID=573065 RepID=E8RVV3_ASTEC|nr:type II toxin-antitoxin system PemK/MazF family toxin [Asticcacaulis excentricus]ADU15375.1 transcriptional modulator of MazE/toxin, MazF [Asticcacaulis excentricus CB 48]